MCLPTEHHQFNVSADGDVRKVQSVACKAMETLCFVWFNLETSERGPSGAGGRVGGEEDERGRERDTKHLSADAVNTMTDS